MKASSLQKGFVRMSPSDRLRLVLQRLDSPADSSSLYQGTPPIVSDCCASSRKPLYTAHTKSKIPSRNGRSTWKYTCDRAKLPSRTTRYRIEEARSYSGTVATTAQRLPRCRGAAGSRTAVRSVPLRMKMGGRPRQKQRSRSKKPAP
jgi:hypothetical protein